MHKFIPYFTILTFLICSCTTKKSNNESSQKADAIFSLQEEINYAHGFAIYKEKGGYLLQIFSPFRDSADTLNFLIGNTREKEFSFPYQKIASPIESAVILASPYAAFLDALNETGIVKGVSTKDYFYNEEIQKGIGEGKISELGFGQNLNTEKLIVLNPQLLIFSGMSSSDVVRYASAAQAGIVLFPMAEWQEQHPLGRAEWIKVFGLLTGKYEASVKQFNEIEQKYLKLKSSQQRAEEPSVIVNAPYKDAWWLPGGKSYLSKLIADAGGNYVWSNNEDKAAIQVDIETIFHRANNADFWINPGQFSSLQDLLAQDGRYREFAAFRNGKVYNNDLRQNKFGGNDYYEKGLVRPDIVLKDLIKIFHPGSLPDHEFYFYRKLP